MENSQVKIFIYSSKPFYYPGEQLLASVYLDVLETVNCTKMTIIAKGKEIIKATKDYHSIEIEEYEESESEENQNHSNEESKANKEFKSNNELNESKVIFKYKKSIQLSKNGNLPKGKYIYPLEIDIPENIPGSFLYLDINTYVEIIYSIKIPFAA